ncbi:14399_t:CDS:2, partial [Rhizophagus irregularis]
NIAPEEVVVSWSYKDYRVAKKIEQTVKRKVIKIDYGLEEGGETTK